MGFSERRIMRSIVDKLNHEGEVTALNEAIIEEIPAVSELGVHENIMPVEDDIVHAALVPDVTELNVKSGVDAFYLDYKLPEVVLFSHIEIWYQARDSETGFDIANATKIYEGLASSFTHGVLEADIDKWHKFWVISIRKTIDSQKSRWRE